MPRNNVNLFTPRPGEMSAHRGHSLLTVSTTSGIASGVEGFYYRRTRFLSRLELKVGGKSPTFASANPVEAHSLIFYYVAPSPAGAEAGPKPEDKEQAGGEIAQKGLEIQVNTYVGEGLRQDVHLTNRAMAPTEAVLGWEVAADFADQSEAQSGQRQQSAPIIAEWAKTQDGGELTFQYLHPDLHHATRLRFSGAEGFTEGLGLVSCRLQIASGQTRTLAIDLIPIFQGEPIEPIYGADGANIGTSNADRMTADWREDCSRIIASDPVVQTAWDRAAYDLGGLQLLEGEKEERLTPAAGVPNYIALFGRDALMASWQSALLNPTTLQGSLSLVGKWTATEIDDKYDAQPGKVLHQRQLSPLALLGKHPFLHYYGDYSASGLFLLGLATDLAHRGDKAFFLSMRDKALATLEWMDRDGDADHTGFYAYKTKAGKQGTKNQGWKDSGQAILHADGRMVENPIAVCEIQGLYYAAKQAIGLAFACVGDHARANDLFTQAASLKARFNERFWMEDERFFALALGPDRKPVRSIASNPGACLAYGIIDADKAAAVVERLMAPDMFSGWGIRTLSSEHPAYNPLAYHLGSVWPFANALACFGFGRYGHVDSMHRLAKAQFDATEMFHLHRLPEVFGGHSRDARHPHPGVYPGACSPQAWSASAIVFLISAVLKLTPLAPINALIADPHLPEWLPGLSLTGLHIGKSRLDLRFRRDTAGSTELEVIRNDSNVRLHRTPPTEAGDSLEPAIRACLS